MKNIRHASLRSLLVLAALCLCAVAATAQAQRRDERFISAKAGGVNFASGKVSFRRAGETAWVALSANDDLKSGDVIKTGGDGRAEVLLNPGSYLRLGPNSEFELADAALDDLQLGLKAGSAVVEATGYSDMDLSISVETPHALARIVRSGIYRFDVTGAGVTEVTIQKGRAYVGRPEVLYKGGKVVRLGARGLLEVAKYEKKAEERDELDLWSRERAKELARMNEKLSRRQANALLSQTSLDLFPSRFTTRGVWYYNARYGYYTFLPFGGYDYWRSPYGHGYGNQLFIPFNKYRCFGCNDGYGGGGVVVRNGGNGGGANTGPYGGNTSGGGSGQTGGGRQPTVGGTPEQPTMIIPRNTQPSRGGGERGIRTKAVQPGDN
jgi:hypothetical protein